jgi:MFS transporter, PPP family, 3-phenylpropionic acid transporter
MPLRLLPYGLFYAFYYSMIGAMAPFLAAFLGRRGLSGIELGLALSFAPLSACFAPLLSGYLADRLRRPVAILRIALAFAALSMAALAFTEGFWPIAIALLGFALANAPIISLADAVTLAELKRGGGTYARIRMLGSVGFVFTALSLGWFLNRRGVDATVVLWSSVALFLALLATLGVKKPEVIGDPVKVSEAIALLRNPRLAVLLVASLINWLGMAPYHTLFSLHVGALGLPTWVVGTSMALGATTEILVMFSAETLLRRFPPHVLIVIAFSISVGRWILTSLVEAPAAVIAVQSLHGPAFGAFYLSAIALLAELVPDRLRATGQGLFVASVFGTGGALGAFLGSAAFERFGGPSLFAGSALLSCVAAVIALRLSPRSEVAARAETARTDPRSGP